MGERDGGMIGDHILFVVLYEAIKVAHARGLAYRWYRGRSYAPAARVRDIGERKTLVAARAREVLW